MTPEEKNYVKSCINEEGFDYTFTSYSWFEEIEDEEFHKLRKEFLDNRKKLGEYVGWNN